MLLSCTHKIGSSGKFYVIYVLPQKIKKSATAKHNPQLKVYAHAEPSQSKAGHWPSAQLTVNFELLSELGHNTSYI